MARTQLSQNFQNAVLPVVLALAGAGALAFAAPRLSFETRLSARTTREERGFLVGLGQHDGALYDTAHAENASPATAEHSSTPPP